MAQKARKGNIKHKILITGGSGFLGFNLTSRLLEKGYDVVVCDNLSRLGATENLGELIRKYPKLNHYKVEIIDVPTIVYKEKPDLIFHFAAQVAVTTSVESPMSDFRINAEGTFVVARTAYDLKIPLIYSSTNKVYGDNVNDLPIKELSTRYDFAGSYAGKGIDEKFSIDARHHTPYGCSKLAGELYVREFGGVVNRFSCMYGRNQHGIVDQGWLAYFIQQKISNKPVTIFGDGKQIRDALYVDDVIDLFELQAERLLYPTKKDIRGEVFSIGGGHKNTISLLELCKIIGLKPTFSNWRPSDQKVFYADISKAKEILGWSPKVSVKKGIEMLTKWSDSTFDKNGRKS